MHPTCCIDCIEPTPEYPPNKNGTRVSKFCQLMEDLKYLRYSMDIDSDGVDIDRRNMDKLSQLHIEKFII